MENRGSNNQEIDNVKEKTGAIHSLQFFPFILILGWEGLLGLYTWLQEISIGLIIAGLFITALFWGMFGGEELRHLIKETGYK